MKAIKLSLTQQSYLMLLIFVLYSLSSLTMKYIQAMNTVENFQNMQEKQFKLILITDSIKIKLSKIQNKQVQHIVDTISNVETIVSTDELISMNQELDTLLDYAKLYKSKELESVYNKINLRYMLLLNHSKNLDLQEIKEDPEEALIAIESMIVISAKINEELSLLIDISHSQLNTAMINIGDKINKRVARIVIFGAITIFIFIVAGIAFTRSMKQKINALVTGTKAFSQNKFDYRIPVITNNDKNELTILANSFNNMAASIEELVDKQQQTNELLDNKVKEQTFKIRKNLEDLEKTNMVVMDSINYASKIQHSLLPDRKKMKNTMGEHFVIWNQRDVVGGDFYWMEEVENGFIVALIDCTGHGVPGSLMTMISVPALDKIIREYKITHPATILSMLNRSLKDMLKKGHSELGDDGLDAGICYVNTKEKKVTFSSAGIPLFYTRNNEIHEIKGERKGVGYKDTDNDHSFIEHNITIDSKMSFYMATDGITEQVGGKPRRMMFGRKRLRELLKNIHVKTKYEQKNLILETLSQYRGNEPQKDDMTCISFKIDN